MMMMMVYGKKQIALLKFHKYYHKSYAKLIMMVILQKNIMLYFLSKKYKSCAVEMLELHIFIQ